MSSADFEIMEHEVPVKVDKDTEKVFTNEFTREVVESMNNQVRLVDSQNGLDLFCYIKCSVSDSDTLKKCRGVVFNNDKVVMNGFPYTYEYTEDDYDELSSKIGGEVFDKCSFYDAYEGSLIRMFYFGDKWYTSTNRKLDANRSKWSSKESFGFFFRKALDSEISVNKRLRDAIGEDETVDLVDRFQNLLDKNKQYMFLLLNNEENRIVCSYPSRPTIFHVGTFIDGILSMEEDIYVPYPPKHEFQNIDDIYRYISDIDINKIQGVIVFSPNNIQYKVFNREYHDLYKVRGNEPSIKFRYLQVRMDKRYNNLIRYLYPEFLKVFDDYENIIYNISKNIHKAYFNRFIKNEFIKVPPEEFGVIRTCHDWHVQNRSENKINLNKVIDILNEQEPTKINKMIRRFYMEQKQLENPKESDATGDKEGVESKSQQRYKPLMSRNNNKKQYKKKSPIENQVDV